MNRFGTYDRSRIVAAWLFATAALVFVMVVIGGVTRLTGSGLSITEWKPIMGAIPPLNTADWLEAFEKYKQIPQYAQVNAGMSLAEFQGIFWWEWLHRLVGRGIGLVFGLPLVLFLLFRFAPPRSRLRRWAMPDRLIWRCVLLLALGGLQGLIGWWMVSSGLSERVSVAPERLAVHLGLAFVLFAALIWTGLEAWFGENHVRPPAGWARGAGLLFGLVFLQCLLGALVAGGKAGLVYTDWPLMNGQVLPPADWSLGAGAFLHDQALTQFNHRLGGYVLLIGASIYAFQAWRWRVAEGMGAGAFAVAGAVWLQALLGVFTLIHAVPLVLGVLHQAGAALVLAAVTANLWIALRAQARIFMSGPRAVRR
nr:COX15/CtaA family protein [uncultured Brevundimonas sp.]